MSTLELHATTKSFGDTHVIHPLDLQVKHGEFMVFVGPSGCGKSTLLRMIAGLEDATSGDIRIDNDVVNSVSAADRGCAMVFQSYALYPHMSVYDNMAFGLENLQVPRPQIQAKVQDAARLLRLEDLLQRKPTQLSGGQRQRVAIARALANNPSVVIADEPTGNLDSSRGADVMDELERLNREDGITLIIITHDLAVANRARRVLTIRDGKLTETVGQR